MSQEQSLQAGTQQAWFMFYDSNGEPSGSTTTALSNGTSSGSYSLRGIQEMPTGVPEAEAVAIPGDDEILGQILFSSDAPREFIVSVGQQDLIFEAEAQNTTVDTVGEAKMGVIDTSNAVLATGALIVQGKAIVDGLPGYSGWIYPLVQLQPLNRETFAGRTAGVIRYKGVAQPAFNRPWGTTILNKSGSQISAYALPFTTKGGPLTMHAFRGAITTMTLDKAPITVAKTTAWSDKIALAVSSVNTPTARLLTLGGASPVNRAGLVVYEYT